MRKKLSVLASRVLWLAAFAVVWTMAGFGGIAVGQVGSVDDPLDMADSSGDIESVEAWVDEGNLHLTMTVYGVFAPSVEDTPAGMTNRYYYHWLLDTDNNPDTGYLNNEYEGNPTNLDTPIGVDVLVQFGWRDGATNGVYAYSLDPSTGDEVELFQDYEYTIDGDTIHAVIPLEDLGLDLGQIIAVSAFQEGASNDWQCDWVESFELALKESSGQVGSVDDPLDMADSSGDIKRLEAWVDEGNLNLTMIVYGVIAPSVEDTPEGMTNRYYYHWLLDTDNNPDTGYLNDEYEGNATNLDTPIGVDVLVQFGWRDGAPNGVYAYMLDLSTGDEVELFADYEYTIDGDTLHAAIPLEDLGLAPGQTIAVSAFQEGASNDWQCDWVESFELTLADTSVSAYNPDPEEGAILTDTWANLSWSPDKAAVSHDIYFGDSYDDVANGTGDTFRGNQGLAYFVVGFPGYPYPDGLVPGTTYYWRIDEVNEADPRSPWKGDVWSFSVAPKTAYSPDPSDGAESIGPDSVVLSWTPGYGAKLHTVYFGDDYDEVNEATGGASKGTTTYTPTSSLEPETVYYWRVDEFDGADTYKGAVWCFTTPGAVGSPQPAYDATDVALNATLRWAPADSAASHELYLGMDKEAVRTADTGTPEYKGSIALDAESYDPGLLEAETTYYWRVDEVDAQGNAAKGPIWIFTTGSYLIVDDFESYTDDDAAGEAIWQTWVDGFGEADNGAQAGELVPPYCEQTIVHGGTQSMPLYYVNEAPATYSEATKPLTALRDLTQAGVTDLSLWFRGRPGNAAEPLYVAVGSAVVAHGNAGAAENRSWTQWRIPLQAFADQGVNLGNVDEFTIGLGSKGGAAAGGSGRIYIDDIRLYRP